MLLHFALPVGGDWSDNGARQRAAIARCAKALPLLWRAHLQLEEELRRLQTLPLQVGPQGLLCPRVPPVVRAEGCRRRMGHAGPVRAQLHAVRRCDPPHLQHFPKPLESQQTLFQNRARPVFASYTNINLFACKGRVRAK